jgi:hypothetical protein
MKSIKSFAAALLLALAGSSASAAVITEAYTGSQFVDAGASYTFDFDLWYANSGVVNDTAPGLTLTTDGQGAFGAWSGANLYIDFYSVDSERDYASVDFDAWGFRVFGLPLWTSDLLALTNVNVSRPVGGNTYYNLTYSFTPSQVAILDDYGWGSVKIGATRVSGNDFDITRVALVVSTAVSTVPEPGTLALLASGLLGLAVVVRRRRVS